jgi:hypothetical protein
MRTEYRLVLTDACTWNRLRLPAELITEVDPAVLRLTSGAEIPVTVVKIAPAPYGRVETPERGLTLLVVETPNWINNCLARMDQRRASRAERRPRRTVREPRAATRCGDGG